MRQHVTHCVLIIALTCYATASEPRITPIPPTSVYGVGRTDVAGSARDLYCWAATTRSAVSEAELDADVRNELLAELDALTRKLDPLAETNDEDAGTRARSLVEVTQKRFAALDAKAQEQISTRLKRIFLYDFLLQNGSDVVSESPEQFDLTADQQTALKKLHDLRSQQFRELPKQTAARAMSSIHDHRIAVHNELTPAQRAKLDAYLDQQIARLAQKPDDAK